MSGVLFLILINCILIQIFLLFTLDQSVVMNASLLFMVECLLLSMFICFTYYYFSEAITEHPFKIGDNAYNSFWYEMSAKQQKAIILMIARSQRESRLTGLGMVDCFFVTFLAVQFIQYSIHILFLLFQLIFVIIFDISCRLYGCQSPTFWFFVI